MSWNVYLRCGPATYGDWNYTHNVNGMIAAAYESVTGEETEQCRGSLGPLIGAAWWDRLDGADGIDGLLYLRAIVKGLESDPPRFRAMNPSNGWGSYAGLLEQLRSMIACAEKCGEYPFFWTASG